MQTEPKIQVMHYCNANFVKKVTDHRSVEEIVQILRPPPHVIFFLQSETRSDLSHVLFLTRFVSNLAGKPFFPFGFVYSKHV